MEAQVVRMRQDQGGQVTASEKLRALSERTRPTGNPLNYGRVVALDEAARALPLIADVVEAAERSPHPDDAGFLTGLDHPTPCRLCAALTALRDALYLAENVL